MGTPTVRKAPPFAGSFRPYPKTMKLTKMQVNCKVQSAGPSLYYIAAYSLKPSTDSTAFLFVISYAAGIAACAVSVWFLRKRA